MIYLKMKSEGRTNLTVKPKGKKKTVTLRTNSVFYVLYINIFILSTALQSTVWIILYVEQTVSHCLKKIWRRLRK